MTRLQSTNWFSFDPTQRRLHFVLDASDTGIARQKDATKLLMEISELLPDFNLQSIGFLGSSEIFAAQHMRTSLADWFRSNSGRLSVIAPVFERTEAGSRVVVLSVGPIFDLMDFKDTPQLAEGTFVTLDGDASTGGVVEQLPADAERIARRVRRSLSSVVINASPGFPVSWDNTVYRLDDEFRLVATAETDYAVRIGVGGPAADITVECLYDDGQQRTVSLAAMTSPEVDDKWILLNSENEANIIRGCLEAGQFQCPHCGKSHARSKLLCVLPGQFLETCVLTEIAAQPEHVMALCKIDRSGGVRFRRLASPVLPIDDATMAVFRNGKAGLVKYDSTQQRWLTSAVPFEQFRPIESLDAYAIYLR